MDSIQKRKRQTSSKAVTLSVHYRLKLKQLKGKSKALRKLQRATETSPVAYVSGYPILEFLTMAFPTFPVIMRFLISIPISFHCILRGHLRNVNTKSGSRFLDPDYRNSLFLFQNLFFFKKCKNSSITFK